MLWSGIFNLNGHNESNLNTPLDAFAIALIGDDQAAESERKRLLKALEVSKGMLSSANFTQL